MKKALISLGIGLFVVTGCASATESPNDSETEHGMMGYVIQIEAVACSKEKTIELFKFLFQGGFGAFQAMSTHYVNEGECFNHQGSEVVEVDPEPIDLRMTVNWLAESYLVKLKGGVHEGLWTVLTGIHPMPIQSEEPQA